LNSECHFAQGAAPIKAEFAKHFDVVWNFDLRSNFTPSNETAISEPHEKAISDLKMGISWLNLHFAEATAREARGRDDFE
jgi:hypothetical protein